MRLNPFGDPVEAGCMRLNLFGDPGETEWMRLNPFHAPYRTHKQGHEKDPAAECDDR